MPKKNKPKLYLRIFLRDLVQKMRTENSLTLLLVCDYLQGQEPTEKDIDESKTLFAYDAFDIEQLFKANNGTFTTKLLAEDDSSAQVPISLHRDSALLESYARWVMHKQLINNRD